MRSLIVIPARYPSVRLPGKPLLKIAGRTLLQRSVEIALEASKSHQKVDVLVATDDERIEAHCKELGVASVSTPTECATGTDRCLAAVKTLNIDYDFVINFQGDAALTPPDFVSDLIKAFYDDRSVDVVTPVTQLSWDQLTSLRESKQKTPFSGTCVVLQKNTNEALWFSKNIIPAMRNEDTLRNTMPLAPVYRHIGIYGYKRAMLETYVTLEEGFYEKLEGLEQLRVLEHGYRIKAVIVDYKGRASMSGIDSALDIQRAESLIAKHGELIEEPLI
jgi:3-deoxy-manno-octulosonate cytidylyltransferase (CMP-KDO synthetase)